MSKQRKPKRTERGQKRGVDVGIPPFALYRGKTSFSEGLDSVVNLLKGRKNIVVLLGAGISVSCGIPDFRSKGTGVYSTLDVDELGLSCAEELFEASFFHSDPRPFYAFARHLYFPLGNDTKIQPSDSHKLLALLEQKQMLLRVYSQNIDGLEECAGVSPKKIVYAHGSLKWATCCKCKRKVSSSVIEEDILVGRVARCRAPVEKSKLPTATSQKASQTPPREPSTRTRKRTRSVDEEHGGVGDVDDAGSVCGGVMKPGVTFFGEALHDNVRRCLEADRNKVDALIVIGTSLSVAPISKVIGYLPPHIPRILINRTIVHPTHSIEEDSEEESGKDFREGYTFDAYLLGFCDDITRALAKKMFSVPTDPATSSSSDTADGKLLVSLDDNDEIFSLTDWSSVVVPRERVFLFSGAQAPKGDDESLIYHEIAHCDGCSGRIVGTIHKCMACFDFDLCDSCFPNVSKTHYGGKHHFSAETARPLQEKA